MKPTVQIIHEESSEAAERGRLSYVQGLFSPHLPAPIARSLALYYGNDGPHHEIVLLADHSVAHLCYTEMVLLVAEDTLQLLERVRLSQELFKISDSRLGVIYAKALNRTYA